jgi:hypothetical protein
MKNLLSILVLFGHMNFTMFIPQLDEADAFDKSGRQVDDINSLYEYIDEVVLGNVDPTPEDEDDDNGIYYHVQKVDDYSFSQKQFAIVRPELSLKKKTSFPIFLAEKIPSVFFEIQSPPPEA